MTKKGCFLLILTIFAGCSKQWVKNKNVGSALGTTYSINYISDRPLDFQKEIDSVFHAINRSLSTYIPTSAISKINQGNSTIVVDHMFADVFELSKQVYGKSLGHFDPTVGVLVNAWGFGPGQQIDLDSARVDSLLRYVGFEKVELTKGGTVNKEKREIFFDFNAVAKGYAVDRMGTLLDTKGISDYLVEIGGEVLANGTNRVMKKHWAVGIDDPQVEEGRQLKRIVKLKNKAMASSGNYRKFRIDPKTRKKYVHTINPKTGFTKNSNVLATSVVAKTCAEADAYATAFMAMDMEDSQELLQAYKELDAYIIYLDSEGKTQEFMTPGFQDLVQN